jgi:deoxyribonuclease IV
VDRAPRRRRPVRPPGLPIRLPRGAALKAHGDLLGAHVSTLGGVILAPERGRAIGASAIQVFTKTPNQWREPVVAADQAATFRSGLADTGVQAVVAHDSYLINLASPDATLRARSERSFAAELERCRVLGIPWVVSHPGNFMDDRAAGLERNARGYAAALAQIEGPGVLIEGTAGAGTALGATFEELAALRDALPENVRDRVGFCLDTAHLHAAGYDVAGDVAAVWAAFDRVVGIELLKCLHLNDSRAAAGSRLDRHAWIGEGTIGPEAFRRIMRDPDLAKVIKIIETPKGDDPVRHDRRMLRRLRAYARGSRSPVR